MGDMYILVIIIWLSLKLLTNTNFTFSGSHCTFAKLFVQNGGNPLNRTPSILESLACSPANLLFPILITPF